MRILNINDILKNENNKVFYATRLLDGIEQFVDIKSGRSIYPSVSDIKDKLRIFPCKLDKKVNMNLGGYRMSEYDKGYAFSCKGSLCYSFVPLGYKEAKRYKVPDMFFEEHSIFHIESNVATKEYNGITWYNRLTMYDYKEYSNYTEHSLCTKEEYKKVCDTDVDDENSLVYFGNQIRVFTDWNEARYYVERTNSILVKDIINEINKYTDITKRDYCILEYDVNNGKL